MTAALAPVPGVTGTITDEQVERANVAYETSVRDLYAKAMDTSVDLSEVRAKSMRAALEAALDNSLLADGIETAAEICADVKRKARAREQAALLIGDSRKVNIEFERAETAQALEAAIRSLATRSALAKATPPVPGGA